MRHRSATRDTDAGRGWTYRETIDEENSAIRVQGRVGRLAVDLLRGTIEDLSRRGHRDITVTMEHPDDVDACARGVLAEVAGPPGTGGGRRLPPSTRCGLRLGRVWRITAARSVALRG